MKRSLKSYSAVLVLGASLFLIGLTGSAQAQVKLEGKANYKIRYTSHQMTTTAHLDRLSNYDYHDHSGTRVILVLSKAAYRDGKGASGYTIASTPSGDLPSRTYFDNINFKGSSKTLRGTFRVLMLVLDGNNQILAGVNFPRKAKIGLQAGLKGANTLLPSQEIAAEKNIE